MIVTDNDLFFAKTRPNAIIPTKRDEDAGYDLYACFDEDFFVIEPLETRPVPTGIATCFSSKYYAQFEERSSTGRLGIKTNAGVIDSGYRGEYLVLTYNANKKPLIITKTPAENLPEKIEIDGKTYAKGECLFYPYQKAICEIVMHVVPSLQTREIPYDELKNISSVRGEKGFGSSGK